MPRNLSVRDIKPTNGRISSDKPINYFVRDLRPFNYRASDTKPLDYAVRDVHPLMRSPGLYESEGITPTTTRVLGQGQSMGLLLSLTYPVAGTVTIPI